MKRAAVARTDGMEALIERAVPKSREVEICFFPEAGTFIRMRGSQQSQELGMHAVLHQVTWRCGSCGAPVVDSGSGGALDAHLDTHIGMFVEAIEQSRPTR